MGHPDLVAWSVMPRASCVASRTARCVWQERIVFGGKSHPVVSCIQDFVGYRQRWPGSSLLSKSGWINWVGAASTMWCPVTSISICKSLQCRKRGQLWGSCYLGFLRRQHLLKALEILRPPLACHTHNCTELGYATHTHHPQGNPGGRQAPAWKTVLGSDGSLFTVFFPL